MDTARETVDDIFGASDEDEFVRILKRRAWNRLYSDVELNPTLSGRFWYLDSFGGGGAESAPLDIFFVL